MLVSDSAVKDGNGNGKDPGRPGRDLLHRMPPSNLEAERCVLGSVILDNAAMHDVAAVLKAEDFFRAAHAELYRAILGRYDAGRPFDVVILAEVMGPEYKAIGGDVLLTDVMDSVAHSRNALYYAQIIRQKAIGRALIGCANAMLDDGYSNEFTAEQLVESAERRVFAIAEAEVTGETLGAEEVVAGAMERLARREDGETTGVATGFIDLDDMTDGLQPGNLVIVAARPSQGKTCYALNVADHVATYGGMSVLFVSLEMGRLELGERLLSSRSRVDSYRLKNPASLTDDDRVALGVARHAFRSSRLLIDDTPMRTVTQIAANARRQRTRAALGLVIVDYIQLIDGQRTKGESRQEEVARISKRLKTLARELDVPVMALAQLNRQSESREDRRPRLGDLRESGQLEADADIVLLIHRPEFYDPADNPGTAEVIVSKNRNGKTGTIKMGFFKSCTRFANMPQASMHEAGTDQAY